MRKLGERGCRARGQNEKQRKTGILSTNGSEDARTMQERKRRREQKKNATGSPNSPGQHRRCTRSYQPPSTSPVCPTFQWVPRSARCAQGRASDRRDTVPDNNNNNNKRPQATNLEQFLSTTLFYARGKVQTMTGGPKRGLTNLVFELSSIQQNPPINPAR